MIAGGRPPPALLCWGHRVRAATWVSLRAPEPLVADDAAPPCPSVKGWVQIPPPLALAGPARRASAKSAARLCGSCVPRPSCVPHSPSPGIIGVGTSRTRVSDGLVGGLGGVAAAPCSAGICARGVRLWVPSSHQSVSPVSSSAPPPRTCRLPVHRVSDALGVLGGGDDHQYWGWRGV